ARPALSPVTPGDPSSITSTPSRVVSITSPSARTSASTLSRSLYVGTQTSARLGAIGGVCPLHRPQPRPYDRRMPPLPRNADVADALDELADVSEILGEPGVRVLAYRRAATRSRA